MEVARTIDPTTTGAATSITEICQRQEERSRGFAMMVRGLCRAYNHQIMQDDERTCNKDVEMEIDCLEGFVEMACQLRDLHSKEICNLNSIKERLQQQIDKEESKHLILNEKIRCLREEQIN